MNSNNLRFTVCQALVRNGPATITELAELTGIDRSKIAQNMTHFEHDGLVTRDGKCEMTSQRLYRVTDLGKEYRGGFSRKKAAGEPAPSASPASAITPESTRSMGRPRRRRSPRRRSRPKAPSRPRRRWPTTRHAVAPPR